MTKEVSAQQIRANRENAKKGGVKTQQGKNISKYNAWKHGILSNTVSEYEINDFEMLYKRLENEFRPETTIEFLLVERIALYQIRLYRASKAEARYIKESLAPSSLPNFDFLHGPVIEDDKEKYGHRLKRNVIEGINNLYLRYEKTLENRLYRALHELERIQRTRKGERVPPPLTIDASMGDR
jgi:hypothetical protein